VVFWFFVANFCKISTLKLKKENSITTSLSFDEQISIEKDKKCGESFATFPHIKKFWDSFQQFSKVSTVFYKLVTN